MRRQILRAKRSQVAFALADVHHPRDVDVLAPAPAPAVAAVAVAVSQHDDRGGDLAVRVVRQPHDRDLAHLRVLQKFRLDLERGHLVPARVEHVHGLPLVVERVPSLLRVVPVPVEHAGAANEQLPGASRVLAAAVYAATFFLVLARSLLFDDLHLHARQRRPDRPRRPRPPQRVRQRHPDLRHPVPFEEDVPARRLSPRRLRRHGARRRAAHGQPERLHRLGRGFARAGRPIERGQRPQEHDVHRRHAHEHRDPRLGRVARPRPKPSRGKSCSVLAAAAWVKRS
eukprot:9032-Pelagococcus_subviridis.AAC.1